MIIGLILIYMMLHLSIALAIGFWLLITAVKQEGWLKILGSVFGWIIIILTIISTLITSYSVIKHRNTMTGPCPRYQMINQEEREEMFEQQKNRLIMQEQNKR